MKNYIFLIFILILNSCIFNPVIDTCIPACGPNEVCLHGMCSGNTGFMFDAARSDASTITSSDVEQLDSNVPTWTQVYAAALDSLPQGAELSTGPRDKQVFAPISSRNCLYQASNWNYAVIPIPHRPFTNNRYEAVEVSVYVISTGSNFRFYSFGDLLGSNYVNNSLSFDVSYPSYSLIGGNTMSGATTIESNLLAFPLNQWVQLRMEVDKEDNLMSIQVDQTLLYRQEIPVAVQSWYSGRSVVLYSGNDAGVCWSMLRVYTRN